MKRANKRSINNKDSIFLVKKRKIVDAAKTERTQGNNRIEISAINCSDFYFFLEPLVSICSFVVYAFKRACCPFFNL